MRYLMKTFRVCSIAFRKLSLGWQNGIGIIARKHYFCPHFATIRRILYKFESKERFWVQIEDCFDRLHKHLDKTSEKRYRTL